MGAALTAMLISLALLAYPAYLGLKAYQLPLDLRHHHRSDRSAALRGARAVRPRDANPVAYAGLYAAEQQRDGLSRHRAARASTPTPQAAYDAALAVVNQAPLARRRAARAAARPPRGPHRGGGAHADHGLPRRRRRARAAGRQDGARIDVRSSSRYGTFDFGANAARIRSLMDDIEDAIAAQKAVRQPTPPPARRPTAAARRTRSRREATQRIGHSPLVATRHCYARQTVAARRSTAAHRSRPRRAPTRSSRCASTERPGRRHEARIEPDIDRAHQASGCRSRPCRAGAGSRPRARGGGGCSAARSAARRARRRRGPADRSVSGAPRELVERGHVVAHRAVGRRHHRRRPRHHVIAREQQIGLLERERHVVGGSGRAW